MTGARWRWPGRAPRRTGSSRRGTGSSVTVAPGLTRELVVREVRDTHVAKARARELYDDVTPPPTPEEIELRRIERFAPPPAPERGSGRPEKRARRQMDRFRGRREP